MHSQLLQQFQVNTDSMSSSTMKLYFIDHSWDPFLVQYVVLIHKKDILDASSSKMNLLNVYLII